MTDIIPTLDVRLYARKYGFKTREEAEADLQWYLENMASDYDYRTEIDQDYDTKLWMWSFNGRRTGT